MYLDDIDAGRMFVCVQNPTAGAFPDDDLYTQVRAARGSRLYMTTQAATQVFAGTGTATHSYSFRIAADAYVEYIAKPLIPHTDSRYHQRIHAEVQSTGVLVIGETVAAGRLAHGEAFSFEAVRLDTTISVNATVRARDVLRLEPQSVPPNRPGIFGQHRYLSTFTAIAPAADLNQLTASLDEELRTLTGVTGAASTLPDDSGSLVRFLSDRAPVVSAAMDALTRRARFTLLHTGPSFVPNRL